MQYIKTARYSVIKRNQFKYLNMRHDDWTLYIVINGTFRCKLNNKNDVISAGDLYFIPPHVDFERAVLKKMLVHFIRFTLNEDAPLPFTMPEGKIKFENNERLETTVQIMKNIPKLPLEQREAYLCHCLEDYLFQYNYEQYYFSRKNGEINDELVSDILSYLKVNYAHKINMADLAAQFGISPSGMIKKFKKATGVLPQRHLINLRIKQAKQLLVDTNIPVTEIAEQSGFENPYYFSKAFKKETGFTPSEYRKAYLI